MGKLRVSRPSLRHERDLVREQIKLAAFKNKPHPVDGAGWWSFATFSWMTRLMYSSYRRPLQVTSIPPIPPKEACRSNTDLLEQLWAKEMSLKSHPRFSWVLWQHSKTMILVTTAVFLLAIFLGLCTGVILLKKILDWASDTNASIVHGVIFVTLLIICEFFRIFFFTLTWALSYRTAFRLKAACMGIVYRKLFRLPNLSDQNAAKVLNIISADCSKIYEVVVSAQVSIGGPITLAFGSAYLICELGLISLVGILIFPAAYPLQYLLAKLSASMKKKVMVSRDTRILYLTQALQNLKFLKMFGWEKHFAHLVNENRSKELRYLLRSHLLDSFSVVLSPMLPHIGTIITFILYLQTEHELTPAKGFTALFIFSLFSYATRTVSRLLELMNEFIIATKRLGGMLSRPEVLIRAPYSLQDDTEEALHLDNVWVCRQSRANEGSLASSPTEEEEATSSDSLFPSSEPENFQITEINLSIKKRSFIGICGHVGSGKSTFLETLTGSLTCDKGHLNVFGRIAYAPQQPWVFKGKLRENVLFGEAFEPVWYYNVISSCCLVNDFGNFGQGDMTNTNDNGENLSGGQKQRINLARALYHFPSREIFLLDDPFSSLDRKVARTIFRKVVMEQLRGTKTVLLVTHRMEFLRECDEILVFSEGRIVERGTHQELMGEGKSVYSSLVAASPSVEAEEDLYDLEDSELLDCSTPAPMEPSGREILTQERGQIPWKAYIMYIINAGGILALMMILLVFATNIGSIAFSSWWLKNWFRKSEISSADSVTNSAMTLLSINNSDIVVNQDEEPLLSAEANNCTSRDYVEASADGITIHSYNFEFYRNVYWGIIGMLILTAVIRTIAFVFTTRRAAKNIHQSLVVQFFQSRLRSVEKFGAGEVLHLFTRDVDEVDNGIPQTMEHLLQNFFLIMSILSMVSLVFPVFLIPLCILCVVFILIRKIYNAAIRDLKRFDSEAKTPIYTLVNDTLRGLGAIRAFGKEQQMVNRFEDLTDTSNAMYYTFTAAIRWLSFRLDTLAVCVTATTAILVLVFHDVVTAAACGLALSYAAQLGNLQITCRLASEMEAKFVSAERMNTFLSLSQSEEDEQGRSITERRGTVADTNPSNNNTPVTFDLVAHPNWPFAGRLKFDSVTLSYSSSARSVLKDLSFEIFPGTKLGIVGRTGSGKSSIGTALFRLTEVRSGHIYLDDVEIFHVPLAKLRNSLCILPQNPTVFQGTLRFNLDPGGSHQDTDLWKVLDKVGLRGFQSLDEQVTLSTGQNQLLSVSRALLRPSVLVFVDEATSSVDVETAALIDQVLAEEFRESTIITVAHRLQALKYCDYLLVLEDGELRDFGPVETIARKSEFLKYFEKLDEISL